MNDDTEQSEEILFPAIPIDSQIINHLLVQKAVIREDGVIENQRIEEYLRMVKQVKTEEHLSFENPLDRSVAIIFELVLENQVDPWNIDLAAFAQMFVGRIKDDLDMDLVIIGEIIYMAFNILKLQSDYLVVHAEELSAPEMYEDEFEYMDDLEELWEDEEDNLFDHIVETSPRPPIEERVRRKGSRKVTLFELVEAFEDAFKEAKKRTEHARDLKEARLKRRRLAMKARKDAGKETHEENVKEDAKEIFRRIVEKGKRQLRFNEIARDDSLDRIKVFVSLLFLAFERKINIRQVNFPYGEIMIENIWKAPRSVMVDVSTGDAKDKLMDRTTEESKDGTGQESLIESVTPKATAE